MTSTTWPASLLEAALALLGALESAHERLYEHDLCLCNDDDEPGDFVRCEAVIAIARARGQVRP